MKRIALAVILSAILVTGAVIAHAQLGPAPSTPGQGDVITGTDLGFRLIRMDGNRPVGELVIRQNVPAPGRGTIWVPVDLGGGRGGVHPLTLK